MEKEIRQSFWARGPESLKAARRKARALKKEGRVSDAHSTMLSAYVTLSLLRYVMHAQWHAGWLVIHHKELSHNQLDVLIQFLIKFRRRLWFSLWGLDKRILFLAQREVEQAQKNRGLPHQVALAYLTFAQVCEFTDEMPEGPIQECIDTALGLEKAIREEVDQGYALKQLVRIFRKVGELYDLIGQRAKHSAYLRESLHLAREIGPDEMRDQVEKVTSLLRATERRR